MDVRPLDLGDMFDRAIGLYARHFRAYFGIAVVGIVPLALWQHPERLGTQHFPTIFDSPHGGRDDGPRLQLRR